MISKTLLEPCLPNPNSVQPWSLISDEVLVCLLLFLSKPLTGPLLTPPSGCLTEWIKEFYVSYKSPSRLRYVKRLQRSTKTDPSFTDPASPTPFFLLPPVITDSGFGPYSLLTLMRTLKSTLTSSRCIRSRQGRG